MSTILLWWVPVTIWSQIAKLGASQAASASQAQNVQVLPSFGRQSCWNRTVAMAFCWRKVGSTSLFSDFHSSTALLCMCRGGSGLKEVMRQILIGSDSRPHISLPINIQIIQRCKTMTNNFPKFSLLSSHRLIFPRLSFLLASPIATFLSHFVFSVGKTCLSACRIKAR